MTRHGTYRRLDVRIETGDRLRPIPIQRWRCAEHGVVSFLPGFLARFTRYLAGVASAVAKAMAARSGKPELSIEVTGPEPRTALRWYRALFNPGLKRWLLRRLRGDPPQSTGAQEMIELAELYARQHSLDPLDFFSVLQSARFAPASV